MFNKKQKGLSKGFTLIELLVVIAIIGLLAGIVLVSLGGARDSARDARVVASMAQIRSIAELVANSNNGSYETTVATEDLCDAGSTINNGHALYGTDMGTLESEVDAQVTGAGPNIGCQADATRFCAFTTLNNGQFYCIDSSAAATQTSTNPDAAAFCGAATTTYVCP